MFNFHEGSFQYKTVFGEVFVHCQRALSTRGLFEKQLKNKIGNVFSGQTSNPMAHGVLTTNIQKNLNEDASKGIVHGTTKVLKSLASTQATLRKGWFQAKDRKS